MLPNYQKFVTQVPDTPAKLKADQAFVERINERLTKRVYTSANRMWLGKHEIRNLRRIVNVNTSGALKHDKNRCMRVEAVKQLVARAEDRLGERAAALVSEKIAPEMKPLDDIYDAFSHAMYAQYQTRLVAQKKAVLIKNTP